MRQITGPSGSTTDSQENTQKDVNFSHSTTSLRRHTFKLLHCRKASPSWFVKVPQPSQAGVKRAAALQLHPLPLAHFHVRDHLCFETFVTPRFCTLARPDCLRNKARKGFSALRETRAGDLIG